MAEDKLSRYRVVMIGGSAGSLDVILKIIVALPSDANLVYVIVVHRKNDVDSILSDLLSSRTTMRVKEVEDKEVITNNTVFFAPPDYHLLFESVQEFSLDSSEKIQYSRPSIDVSFESAVNAFGDAVIGVLLSGANADGAEGLHSIKRAGGYSIVQDPASADVAHMPQQAINKGELDAILSPDQIAAKIIELAN